MMLVFDAEKVASPDEALKARLHQGAADKFKLDFDEIKKRMALPAQSSKFIAMPWRKCSDPTTRTVRRPFVCPAQMINSKSNTAPVSWTSVQNRSWIDAEIYARCADRIYPSASGRTTPIAARV